jgi:hypothetical protein
MALLIKVKIRCTSSKTTKAISSNKIRPTATPSSHMIDLHIIAIRDAITTSKTTLETLAHQTKKCLSMLRIKPTLKHFNPRM